MVPAPAPAAVAVPVPALVLAPVPSGAPALAPAPALVGVLVGAPDALVSALALALAPVPAPAPVRRSASAALPARGRVPSPATSGRHGSGFARMAEAGAVVGLAEGDGAQGGIAGVGVGVGFPFRAPARAPFRARRGGFSGMAPTVDAGLISSAYRARFRPRGLVRPVSQERTVARVTPTAAATCSSLSDFASRSLRRSLGEGSGGAAASSVVLRVMGDPRRRCTG
ncbi:hypothetical protein V9U70_19850 [Streptomyces pratensis]